MRILICEDDFASRKLLYKFLSRYGKCDMAVNGIEAIEAFNMAWDEKEPYEFICLDIMMPKIDGIKVLKSMREFENKKGVAADKRAKVIMMTALSDTSSITEAYKYGCESYVSKPVDISKLEETLTELKIV